MLFESRNVANEILLAVRLMLAVNCHKYYQSFTCIPADRILVSSGTNTETTKLTTEIRLYLELPTHLIQYS
jgi:hypothetical protein